MPLVPSGIKIRTEAMTMDHVLLPESLHQELHLRHQQSDIAIISASRIIVIVVAINVSRAWEPSPLVLPTSIGIITWLHVVRLALLLETNYSNNGGIASVLRKMMVPMKALPMSLDIHLVMWGKADMGTSGSCTTISPEQIHAAKLLCDPGTLMLHIRA